jgi:hypothetical protein
LHLVNNGAALPQALSGGAACCADRWIDSEAGDVGGIGDSYIPQIANLREGLIIASSSKAASSAVRAIGP